MKKTYLIGSLLLAGATSLSASAQNVVTLKAADYGVEGSGVVVDGVTEDGSSQVRPLKSVSFEGVTMSFDQNGEDNSEPAYFTAPAYTSALTATTQSQSLLPQDASSTRWNSP